MEESAAPISETNAARPPARRPRASLRAARGLSPAQIHAYAPWALVAAVVILALAVLGVISVPGQRSESWQAVFLTNGQAYFGHVARVTPNWLTLRDVHYLTTQDALSSRGPEDRGIPSTPSVTLMKLGKELHGPEDEMRINREHVLFIEVLRSDSAVVRTIETAQAQPDAETPPPTDAPPTNATPPPQE